MHKFDYNFLKNGIDSRYIKLSNLITDLKTKESFRQLQYKESFRQLNNKAIYDSTVNGCLFDDLSISNNRLNELLKGKEPVNQIENEILAYRNVLLFINENSYLDIDEDLIKRIHNLIVPFTFEVNKYRSTDDNLLDEISTLGIQAIKSNEISNQMYELIKAYKSARSDDDIPNLLLVPCFILDFLAINPYSEGVNRISFILTNLLLNSFSLDIGKYISIESILYEYKNNYEQAIKESLIGWKDNKNSYDPFIFFFLQVIYKAYKQLDDLFIANSLKKLKKKDRVLLTIQNSKYPLSKKDIQDRLPDISIRTLDVVLADLIKQCKIQKVGSYKDAKYIKV